MRLYVIMGVAGCGKTSVGEGAAKALQALNIKASYQDGDNFHPAANIAKMSQGQPLDDADRWPWLERIGQELAAVEGISLIGCSALKRSYRDLITKMAGAPVCFIYLEGSKALIGARMAERKGHFMPTALLDSQFATLEVPSHHENSVAIDISGATKMVIDLVVAEILKHQKETPHG